MQKYYHEFCGKYSSPAFVNIHLSEQDYYCPVLHESNSDPGLQVSHQIEKLGYAFKLNFFFFRRSQLSIFTSFNEIYYLTF